MDITTAAPAEIDAEIARLTAERAGLDGGIARFARTLKTYAGFTEVYLGSRARGFGYRESLADAENVLRPLIASGDPLPEVRGVYGDVRPEITRYLAQIDAIRAECARLDAEIAPLHDEFDRRGGWTRFFLVNNANGHVHSSTGCSTCYATTVYKWITEFSGQDEAETVAKAGERACTVCYPSAPVDRPAAPAFRSDDEIATAAREAEKAAKLDGKRAKAIFADDPRAALELRDDAGRLVGEPKTIIAVERQYGEQAERAHVAAERARRHGEALRRESARPAEFADAEAIERLTDRLAYWTAEATEASRLATECLTALAARHGEDVETRRAVYAAKIAKRCAKAYI